MLFRITEKDLKFFNFVLSDEVSNIVLHLYKSLGALLKD